MKIQRALALWVSVGLIGLVGISVAGAQEAPAANAQEATAADRTLAGDAVCTRCHDETETKPILATCAGMIIADCEHLGLLDIATRRNAFGRQLASFEADLAIAELGAEPFRAVFIRAPWAESLGDGVELLAEWEGHPVGVREGSLTAYSFHPELSGDDRLHRALLDRIAADAPAR